MDALWRPWVKSAHIHHWKSHTSPSRWKTEAIVQCSQRRGEGLSTGLILGPVFRLLSHSSRLRKGGVGLAKRPVGQWWFMVKHPLKYPIRYAISQVLLSIPAQNSEPWLAAEMTGLSHNCATQDNTYLYSTALSSHHAIGLIGSCDVHDTRPASLTREIE